MRRTNSHRCSSRTRRPRRQVTISRRVLAAGGVCMTAMLAMGPVQQPAQSPGSRSPSSAQESAALPRVRTASPTPAATSRDYTIPGRTEPYESSSIFTRATGVVRERAFDIGDLVNAGDVMTIIDAPEIDRAVDSAQATLDQEIARSGIARQLAERATALIESKLLSREEVDQRHANAVAADAAVRVAQAELERLRAVQGFATVRAPFTGVVAGRNFDRGDRVRGDTATADGWLYRLVRLDRLRFIVAAPPDLALRLDKNSIARIAFRELPGRTIEAGFLRSSGVIDRASGTMRVEFLIDNSNGAVPAGLTGTATVAIDAPTEAFALPTNTVMVDGGQSRVAVVRQGAIRFVPVRVGRNLGRSVEVTSSDLAADDKVVVNPNAMLREGDRVEVVVDEKGAR